MEGPTIRTFHDGHELQLLIDFGPRVHFTVSEAAARLLRDELQQCLRKIELERIARYPDRRIR